MIGREQARQVAEGALRELEQRIGTPLAIWDMDDGVAAVEDHGEVWTVNWNSVAYLESRDIFVQVLMGPIAVPKDGGDWFVLPTWGTVDEMLADRPH